MRLIYPDYFNLMSDPVGWKIDPAAVTAQFDLFFDHLFAVNFKFDLAFCLYGNGVIGFEVFIVMHK